MQNNSHKYFFSAPNKISADQSPFPFISNRVSLNYQQKKLTFLLIISFLSFSELIFSCTLTPKFDGKMLFNIIIDYHVEELIYQCKYKKIKPKLKHKNARSAHSANFVKFRDQANFKC